MQLELKALQRETGITFIFVTHDQEEALTMSDRIAVMSAGEIQQLGSPKDIYEHPDNVFVAGFIGETNLLPVSVDEITNGHAHCHLGGGHKVICSAVEGVAVGNDVHISVRPERLRMSAQPSDQQSLPGTVVETVYVGSDVQSYVQLNEGPLLTIRTQNSALGKQAIFALGTQTYVTMETGAARLLQD
jgi:spermidine/putrescine transport system ATP-binding protein